MRGDCRERQREKNEERAQERRRAPLAAEAAATPKISTGIVSGSTRIAMSRPPRLSETVSAAPIAPIIVSAGVPAASVAAVERERQRRHRQHEPEQRTQDNERQCARRPVRSAFHQHDNFERRRPIDEKVERAVVMIGLEQPVEPEEGREQGRDPKNRGPEPREQIEVGSERKRHDRDQNEEEHDP